MGTEFIGKGERMEIREFAQEAAERLRRVLGTDYSVKIEQMRKNNGHKEVGLSVRKGESNIAPVIYLDALKKCFEEGKSMDWVTGQLFNIAQENIIEKNIDIGPFRKFETARERIVYKLINAEKNKEELNNRPYVEFLDLAIVFYYLMEAGEMENGMIQITNEHRKLWNVDTFTLMEAAFQNSQRLLGAKLMDLKEMLKKEYEVSADLLDPLEDGGMKILSNKKGRFGAGSILYPGLLNAIANEEGANLYLLPSSVHEFLLLPDRSDQEVEWLEESVHQVNREEVAQEDFLSDNVYYYDREADKVKLL